MRNFLAAILSRVYYASISGRCNTLLLSNLRGNDQEMTQKFTMPWLRLLETANQFFRNDKKMSGSLRVDVSEDKADVVLIEDVGGDLLADDLTENGLFGHEKSVPQVFPQFRNIERAKTVSSCLEMAAQRSWSIFRVASIRLRWI